MKKILIVITILLLFGVAVPAIAASLVSIKGCWESEYIMAQTGGGSQPPSSATPLPSPFYAVPASKRIGYSYLNVDTQTLAGKFAGILLNYNNGWLSYPIEGYISGNLISYYSYVPQGNSISGLEEQRIFNGMINSSREIFGTGMTARNLNPDSIPEWQVNPALYMYRWTVIPFTVKFFKVSDSLCSSPPTPAQPLTGYSQCLPSNAVCPPPAMP
jgi:hypothetical protein